jgi:cell division protein FtsB
MRHRAPDPVDDDTLDDEAPPRRRRRRKSRFVLPLLGSFVAVGALFIGVFPTRAILDQRRQLAQAQQRLDQVDARNQELEDRVQALGTDDEIERLAREEYDLVFPGQEAYAILPSPPAPPAVPDAWPFRQLHDAVTDGAP